MATQGNWVFNPNSGGKPIPELVRQRTDARLRRYAEKHYAGRYTRLEIRFRSQFCYVDAYTEPAEPGPKWPPANWPDTREEQHRAFAYCAHPPVSAPLSRGRGASRLAATWFPPESRGRAFGFHQTAYTIAPIFAPFIAVPIAQATGSWRWSFMVIAFFGLPVLAAIDRFVSDRPERDLRTSQPELDYIFGAESHKKGGVLDPARAVNPAELPPGERPTPYREIFLSRSVALMFIAGFFGLLATGD